ncbi:MAG: dihydropteroate synthase [Halioglobus sp.]
MHTAPLQLDCGGRILDLSSPAVMGVINTTPDSFSDGGALFRGKQLDIELAMSLARSMVSAGARILDIGGESTRPGAMTVSASEELDRVLPLVARIATELDVVVSVDTSSPELMIEAAKAGAGLLNDVRALERQGALQAAAATGLPVCLMHMQGSPANMQDAPGYGDVVSEVGAYLAERVSAAQAAGIVRENILLDPGFGFGKTVEHNLELLRGIPRLAESGLPILVGLSRKSLIGLLIGREVADRLAASLALAVLAVERGAHIIRAHDVAETVDAVSMVVALAGVESND